MERERLESAYFAGAFGPPLSETLSETCQVVESTRRLNAQFGFIKVSDKESSGSTGEPGKCPSSRRGRSVRFRKQCALCACRKVLGCRAFSRITDVSEPDGPPCPGRLGQVAWPTLRREIRQQ